ncbi:cytochrome P460 family protein [Chitinophaga arvensicola]|uniref:Cytochrome P460 n=1 Tax=Chitinophaga arvensicola TaxID=29529 RepID=A0A1I0S5G5_9BACT|nr:cytochrome P460 family protein [Chitinophaga arvensicola]SEW50102.1 Cytochrome P460 [Chitinophaga arvensicola]
MKYILFLSVNILLFSCSPHKVARINTAASLHDTVLLRPHEWKVITSTIQTGSKTMCTLYGNETAVNTARKGGSQYPGGALLTLVTWKQQPDDHWFGALIPGEVESVEQVQFTADAISPLYKKYTGNELRESPASEVEAQQRTAYIVGCRAAVMP